MLHKKQISSGTSVGVWAMTEPLQALQASVRLDEEERQKLEATKMESKKRELLCTRALIKELTGEGKIKISYNEYGKPFLKNSGKKISISHTQNFVAVIIDNHETGIDIQYMDPKIERISHKFMGETELKSMTPQNRREQLSVYWCAKEALYKLYGNKKLDFKKDLVIEPFEYKDSGKIGGRIITGSGEQRYNLWYEKIAGKDDTMLVYVLNHE